MLLAFTVMNKLILSIFSIVFLVAPGSAQFNSRTAKLASVSVDPFSDADRLFTFGEDAQRDKQSLVVIERALSVSSNEYQWLWRAARSYYYVGDSAGKVEKLSYFERGMDAGQRAVAQQPNAVEGHFWLAANYGGYSEEKGAFRALSMVKKIRAEMEKVLRLNDRYLDGAAYLALGELDRQLPLIVGGSLKRAITRLEQGMRIAPDNLEMKFALAQAYQDAGRTAEARRQLEEIVNRQINTSRARAERDVQEKARKMLGRL